MKGKVTMNQCETCGQDLDSYYPDLTEVDEVLGSVACDGFYPIVLSNSDSDQAGEHRLLLSIDEAESLIGWLQGAVKHLKKIGGR